MKNPVFNKSHIKEYLLAGFIATVFYIASVLYFLSDSKYENFYIPYIGNFLFIAVIGYYTSTLINRQYEGKRAVSMLISGHLALIAGIIFSILLVILSVFMHYPDLFTVLPPDKIIQGAPDSIEVTRPTGLIFMLEANTILVSGGGSSFLIVIFSYAAKRNQTKDKPASLHKFVKN